MQVVYSIGAKFGASGIGYTAMHAVKGIYQHDTLKRVLASYAVRSSIPQNLVKTFGISGKLLRRLAYLSKNDLGYYVHDSIYDFWASRQIEQADVFHGWNNHCLRSLRVAKSKGMKTVVERASAHT